MSNRSDVSAILADIDDTISRVRDLSTSPERAAALQCLADARRHLARAGAAKRMIASEVDAAAEAFERAQRQADSGHYSAAPSVPPSCSDNQRVRTEAGERFRESRRLLRDALK